MKKQDGYVQDVSYPPHFHREMQPVWLAAVASFAGTVAPDLGRPYAYCELGCGMGINLLVAAACNPLGNFVGVDFNERHLAIARDAAQAAGLTNVHFEQADFARFAQSRISAFDFIVSHGVWSWVSVEQQRSILRLLHQSLKPQGLFYLHYMCHPGATQMIPVQKLLNELAPHITGTSEQGVRAGIDLLRRLDGAGAFVDQPRLSASLRALSTMNTAYLAHDFLTDHWRPQHSADVHRLVARDGIAYLGSANPFENLEELSIPGALLPSLQGLPSPALREMVKDMARNQHQRQDMFQRAPVTLSAQEHLARVGAVCFGLLPGAPQAGEIRFSTPIGEITGPAAVFAPLLARLGEAPASFGQLQGLPVFAGRPGLLAQSLQMLMWHGSAHPLREETQDCSAAVGRLQAWMVRQRIHLRLVESCGTALPIASSPEQHPRR